MLESPAAASFPFFPFLSTSVFPFPSRLLLFTSPHLTLPQTIELKLTPVKWSVSPLKSGNRRQRISVLLFFLFLLYSIIIFQSILAFLIPTVQLTVTYFPFLSSLHYSCGNDCVLLLSSKEKKEEEKFPYLSKQSKLLLLIAGCSFHQRCRLGKDTGDWKAMYAVWCVLSGAF